MNSVRSNKISLKFQSFTPSGCKEKRTRKSEFVAKTCNSFVFVNTSVGFLVSWFLTLAFSLSRSLLYCLTPYFLTVYTVSLYTAAILNSSQNIGFIWFTAYVQKHIKRLYPPPNPHSQSIIIFPIICFNSLFDSALIFLIFLFPSFSSFSSFSSIISP